MTVTVDKKELEAMVAEMVAKQMKGVAKKSQIKINAQALAGSNVNISYFTEGEVKTYVIELLRNQVEPVYTVTVVDPDGPMALIRAMVQELAKDKSLRWGIDQRPYIWNDAKWDWAWFEVKGWATILSNALGLEIGKDVGTPGVLKTLYETWIAQALPGMSNSEAQDYLMLMPFGTAPGITFSDGTLVRENGQWKKVKTEKSWNNCHCLPVTCAEALEAMAAWKRGDYKAEYKNGSKKPEAGGLLWHYLTTSFSPEQADLYGQWAALHCVAHIGDLGEQDKFVLLQGAGGNGKKPAMQIIEGLVTKDAAEFMNIQDVEPRTADQLMGKVAMLGTEAPSGKVNAELLKQITSREKISANPKYRNPFSLRVVALLTQSCNVMIDLSEKSDALEQRAIVLKMTGTFRVDEEARIRKLAEKIMEAEYPQLVGWMLANAEKVIDSGTLTIPESVKKDSREATRANSQIDGLSDNLEWGNFAISTNELRAWYKRWCAVEGKHELNMPNLIDELKRYAVREGKPVLPTRLIKRTGYYSVSQIDGVKLPKRLELIYGIRIAAEVVTDKAVGMEWEGENKQGENFKGARE